ncbi:MAG: hypothetical protein HY427_02860 [Candidatus Levybacteria bacterium]|nr:hypothetical protein [Candidatus Levybacteria bacterium]
MERLRVPQFLSKKASRRVFLGGSAIAAFVIACGGGKDTSPQVQKGDTPTLPPAPAETPTLEPTPTATEVVKAPVNCEVLPQEFCSQGEIITMELQGVKHVYAAFNLPSGTPIFARFDGLLDKSEETGNPFSGLSAILTSDNYSSGDVIKGNLRFDDMIQRQVRQGDIIGYVGDSGINNFGYNVLYGIATASPDGPIVDEAKMRELFPEAFEKEDRKIEYNGPVKPPVSYSYESTPPGQ